MGSKKHKKESKKKRHRSRSRSDSEERQRKRQKKHKDRKKDRSPEVEEVPVDSHLDSKNGEERSRSRSISKEVRSKDRDDYRKEEPERSIPRPPSPQSISSSGNKESLSIEDTNRIRAKLGLKPLEVNEKPAEDGKLKDDLGEFYHLPAQSLTEKKKSDKLREKISLQKEKRKIEEKIRGKGLAEEEGEDDVNSWVQRSREIERRKKEAEKRAAILDELDEEFGVGALVDEEQKKDKEKAYSQKHLKGLRVAHDFNALDEDSTVVLTLADKQVLADDDEDVLVNVNMVDNEKYKKNIETRKKARAGYQAYDDEEDINSIQSKGVLSKYDEEIEPDKQTNKGFRIGDDDALEAARFREMMARSRALDMGKRLESLQLPALAPASDYYSEQEVQTKFKKIKKKGKSRKKPKVEPIDVEDYDPNMAPLETDDTEVKPEVGLEVDDDEVEPDAELQRALARARRLRQIEATNSNQLPKVEELLSKVKSESPEPEQSGMVLDSTAEFCRTLGDIPTYGQAGNRDQRQEIMDFEDEDLAEPTPSSSVGQWASVEQSELSGWSGEPTPVQLVSEPSLDGGVGAALQLALSKGYLEKAPEVKARAQSGLASLLHAHHYSIDDKQHAGDDEKPHRRERGGYSGPIQEFREKNNFKPNIKLEYVDDDGRPLCPKEAFRYLSHKFHGKGPGKNKQEKRIKKSVQEGLMKKMSSTDTPLNTLALLQEKQKETASPFIVLTGTKKDTNI